MKKWCLIYLAAMFAGGCLELSEEPVEPRNVLLYCSAPVSVAFAFPHQVCVSRYHEDLSLNAMYDMDTYVLNSFNVSDFLSSWEEIGETAYCLVIPVSELPTPVDIGTVREVATGPIDRIARVLDASVLVIIYDQESEEMVRQTLSSMNHRLLAEEFPRLAERIQKALREQKCEGRSSGAG